MRSLRALKFFDQSQHRRYSGRIGAGLGKVLEKPERKIMPVEEPRRKRNRGIEEQDLYPEPKRETKPQIVPPGPPKPTQESAAENEMIPGSQYAQ